MSPVIISTSDASLTTRFEEPPVPGREVVEHPHRFAAGHQRRGQVGADEPGSARDQIACPARSTGLISRIQTLCGAGCLP